MFFSTAANASNFMPPKATAIAANVDSLYIFLLWASFISCVLVIGGLIWFAIKYRRTPENTKTPYISHNTLLEFLWSFIPFVIFMVAFVWGWIVYHQLRSFPENALEIAVQAQKWSWTFVYKNGRTSSSEFVVPVNRPVKLVMSSSDVLHSFYVPAFRNKQDVVPGRYTPYWFQANKIGSFNVFCAEYCGDQHSMMLAKVNVVSEADYEKWLVTEPYKGLSLVEIGREIYMKKACIGCHTLTTENKATGPGWGGIWGKNEKLADGSTVLIDENYIRESLLDPNAKVVAGYGPPSVMPTQAGQISEQEILGVIEFIKSLK